MVRPVDICYHLETGDGRVVRRWTTGTGRPAMEGVPSRILEDAAACMQPLVVHLELTHRCDNSCVHCYLPVALRDAPRHGECSAEEWERILDVLQRKGTLTCVVSGGEPTRHPEWKRVLAAIRRRRMAFRLLTNGNSLAGEADFLAKLAPLSVEISILAASAGLHDALCGRRGAFSSVLSSIRALREAGVRVALKFPVMNRNYDQFHAVERLAETMGCSLKYDPCITPRIDGDESTAALALSTRQLEEFVEKRLREAAARGDARLPEARCPEHVACAPSCGACLNSFAVAPDGTLMPCVELRSDLGNLLELGDEVFRLALSHPVVRDMRRGRALPPSCRRCALRHLCDRCPGQELLSHGRLDAVSESYCERARAISRAVERVRRAACPERSARPEETDGRSKR